MDNLVSLGRGIREARLKNNFTMDFVAKNVGISRATLSAIENGSANFSVETLFRLLNFFGLSFELNNKLEFVTKRIRATRVVTWKEKKINRFVVTCIEMYSKYKGLDDKYIYRALKEHGILKNLKDDYDDLHGFGTEYLNDYIDSLMENSSL